MADFDNDGDLDLFVVNIGGDKNFLYQNNGSSNHWINVKCIGTLSNTSAIGAKVRAKATINSSSVWQIEEISGQTGAYAQNSLNVEFGLGDATVIDSLIVFWPASKTTQVFTNITADQFLTITETDLLPAVPKTLEAEPADQQATLNWNLNTEIDFLRNRIYGGTAPNPTTVVDSVDGLPNATKTISGLSNGTTYFFRITALDASLQESSFSNEINVTPFALGRITSGEIPADAGNSTSASWPDFDNDDDLDLFVTNQNQKNFLYSNNGDGSFSKITSGALVDFAANHLSSTWGDFDNDGDLDVFIANGEEQNNFLLENRSDGSFTRITSGVLVKDAGNSFSASWGDYDNDRNLDLFVANQGEDNFLYRNNGDGTFSKITADPVVTDGANSTHGSWADFDLDNDLDLFVTNDSNQDNFFYRNNGDGTFTKVINDVIVTDGGESMGSSWGDFDGDNVLDLFVANRNNQNNFLYRNNGDGTFTKITTGTVVKEGGSSLGSAWADFDNDGDLDLSVTNEDGTNFLYTNRGDGTFTKITTGAVVNDFGRSHGAAWSDFDRDGDLDLFVANSNNENNLLYSNSLAPEGNRWLNIKCVGTASNTSAIGAKVQVKATVFGQPKWQLREISAQSGGGSGGQNLHAAYGLGDAAVVDTIKIEWPSGIVDILTNIEPNQFLTISEAVANRAPIANVAFSDTTLIVGGPALSRDLEAEPTVFSDEDGDPLIYRAGSSNSSVATAGVSGSVLTVTAQAPGTATITVTANDGKGGSGSLTFNVTVEANLPPVVDHTPPTVQESGQVINLTVNASDDLDIANVFLNYRQGGGIAFTTAGMLRSDNTFNGTIPASFVDSRGVEYFISATDLAGVQTRVPTNSIFSVQVHVSDPGAVKGTAQPGGSEQIAYRLISVPIDLENKNPRAIFEDDLGPFDIFKWRFFEIRADQNRVEFPNTSNMTQGKAFWLIVKEPDQVIDTGAGTSNSTLQEFAITLHPQWNTIGNPFNFSIPLSNMRLASGEIPEFRFFTGSWNDPVNAPVTVVQPFEGYAIFNNSTSTDTLFVDPDLSASARVSRKEALRAVTKTVSAIHILAQSQQARDIDNIAGITANAAIAWDGQDRPEPPVIGEYVSVYFPHPEWDALSENYCTDFRPQSSDGEVWEFEVKTNIRDVVHLTFQPSNSLEPSEGLMPEMWLLDEALNVSQNLQERNSYFVAGSENYPKRLKLVVGKPNFVQEQLAAVQSIPSTFELSQNFPNPFNPTTTIRYGLPAPGRVTLKIYNVLGEEVLTLVDDVPRQAGYHAAVWDGRNEKGQRVASGLYFYQLRMDEILLTKKMALVR
ncbi:MAG: FG-GAP-like repeat-containing protein [bacterium]